MPGQMNRGFPYKPVLLLFFAVLGAYLGVFHGIEYWRHRQGPWEVRCEADAQGTPVVVVTQPGLGVADVRLVFRGERMTNRPGTVRFDKVRQTAPTGRVIYEDLTFLPGVVTFDFFGHEVELLPRTLVVNKRAWPWRNGTSIDLWPTNKPAHPPQPPTKRRRGTSLGQLEAME